VIVRIALEGQYRVDDALHDRLNELDDAAVDAVEAGDEDLFQERFDALLSIVRSEGVRLGDDELVASDVIFPPADVSFAEASRDFTGEGLIPD
jgi:hypothetical protein